MPKARAKPTPSLPPPVQPIEQTIGLILGLEQAAPLPNPAFAAFADTPEELDLFAQEHRPGENEPPPGQRPPEPPTPPAEEEEDADDPADDPEKEESDGPTPDDEGRPAAEAAAEQDELFQLNAQRARVHAQQRARHGLPPAQKALDKALDGDILPAAVRYESRISIVDAWRYPGSLALAPSWVDRNWAGYADDDPVRGILAGPALRVPSNAVPGEVVLARIGDYVCQQSVVLDAHITPVMRVEVWTADQFNRLFMPVSVPADAPRRSPTGQGSSALGAKSPAAKATRRSAA